MIRMLSTVDLPIGDPGLKMTSSALEHIRKSLFKVKALDQPVGLRVGIKKAGCSGYEYQLEYAFANSQKPLDYIFTFEDITVLIDKEIYLKFLKGGTTVDFRKEGINAGLAFDNPNVANQCGCGESFTLVDE